eukprot:NODE_970_length_2685_cov_0.314772.p1 type:complete len:239 gc:universal NODE_970_length_2685_cov_0.314772:2116-1400(-)
MLSRSLLARRIDQKYSKLVWSKVPNNERIIDKRVIDINALNFVPNMMSFEFLNECSLIKSYLLKRQLEFPKLKQFHVPYKAPTGYLKFKCTTNLFDMEHDENNKCVMTVPIAKISEDKDFIHILKVLAREKLYNYNTEIKITCDRFPFYRQNMRWCFEKYQEMIKIAKSIKNEENYEEWLNHPVNLTSREKAKKERILAKRFPSNWLIEADKSVIQSLIRYGRNQNATSDMEEPAKDK